MNYRRETGASLLTLLIGMVISMIAVLGVMNLFRTTLHSNTESGRDARISGERATGILIASMDLQGAGFGMPMTDALPENLRLLTGASLSEDGILSGTDVGINNEGSFTGNALIWRFNQLNAVDLSVVATYCAGIYAPEEDAKGGLYQLLPYECDLKEINDAHLSAIKWTWQPLIADEKQSIRDVLHFTIGITHFPATKFCRGLGIGGNGYLQATLKTKHDLGNTDSIPIESTTCLLNYPRPVPPAGGT